MAGLDEAGGCSREEATPEDEDEDEELLPSQSHEAGPCMEGQCLQRGLGSLGSCFAILLLLAWPRHGPGW